MSTALALDHVGVAARDLPPLVEAYQKLGFSLSPIAQQSGRRRPDLPVEQYGSGNRCAFLKHGYVELIAILDPALYDNGIGGWLTRYTGLHIVALAMAEEQANLERLRRAGIDIPGVAWLERPVEAGGPIAKFARLPLPEAPEGRVQLIRHLTPELVWQPRWMDHANKAEALEAVVLVTDTPAESAARFSRLAGLPVQPDPAGGFVLVLPGQAGCAGPQSPQMETRVRILDGAGLRQALPGVPAPALPGFAGMVIRTSDGAAAARALIGGAEAVPGGLLVPPALAGGAAILFT